jgi:exopolysaccharide biosynthesis polyprenyl glycosylphosphotransferase
MRSNTRRIRAYILLLGDSVLLYAALILTLFIRYRALEPKTLNSHLAAFTPLFLTFLVIFYASRLYDLVGPQSITTLILQAFYPLAINAAFAVGYFYFLGAGLPGSISPRTNLALFFTIFTILFFLWRRFSHKLFGKTLITRAVAIGNKTETEKLANFLHQHPEYGYQITYAASQEELNLELLRKLIRENGVTAVIAAPHSIKAFAPYITELAKLGIDFWDLVSFYETRLERIPLSLVEETWLLEKIVWREPRAAMFLKAAFDRLLALIMLILTLPLWPIIAVAIKLTSDGPVFYSQVRIGYGGKPFRLLKFRTMYQDAEKHGPQWAQANDPRITPIGKILRKLQLDELPQLWNILKGEMSFVGPRPERPEFVEELRQKIPFYDLRHLVKPGLTGWAQLNFRYGASIEDAREKLEYDLYYIKNRSLILDLAILLKTLSIILRGGTGR